MEDEESVVDPLHDPFKGQQFLDFDDLEGLQVFDVDDGYLEYIDPDDYPYFEEDDL